MLSLFFKKKNSSFDSLRTIQHAHNSFTWEWPTMSSSTLLGILSLSRDSEKGGTPLNGVPLTRVGMAPRDGLESRCKRD